ncbi:SPL family radical SAM protein [Parabacteroides pacaensis]|uniref:SPL family radical SAM protein n=1 Tax=Parabacteroides pacaensis TaxID=2086575 RepID=UPI000D113758|nr:radical SAM protein [Parabacteroides pacaensis]
MVQEIETKSILSRLRQHDPYFGITYNMNLYRGCQHGCIYCDTRSTCYQIGDIENICVKINAIPLLERELRKKREKGTIGTGSMNDPYMSLERKYQQTRKALSVIASAKFPVHIITKSDLVIRDRDIIQEISQVYAAVSFTVTTATDLLARKLEPGAPVTSSRFTAMKYLASKGIYTGITLMPVLPFVNDTVQNITEIVHRAKDNGASYILPMFGVTLREGSREYLYKSFDRLFPGMRQQYEQRYGNQYECFSPHYQKLWECFLMLTDKYNISSKISMYNPGLPRQLSLF